MCRLICFNFCDIFFTKKDFQRRVHADSGCACKKERTSETWSESELNAAWQEQTGWLNAEEDFSSWYDTSFRASSNVSGSPDPRLFESFVHLEKFPNLQNVETTAYWVLSYGNPNPRRFGWMVNFWGVERGDDWYCVHESHPNRCLELFCLQLERSRKNISSLRVTSIGEILDRPGMGLNLANLPSLTIDLAADADYACRTIIDDPDWPDWNFSDWFKSAAPRLENLKIIQRWTTTMRDDRLQPALDIFELLASGNVRFPMLQALHLQHVTTTPYSLNKFLSVHRKTLVSLKIDRPCIYPKEWNEMKERVEQEAEQGYYGPESECEVTLTDAMTDPMGIDKEWKPFDSLIW